MITKIFQRMANGHALNTKDIARALMLFDATYYLSTNPDVASAVREGAFVDALDHFKRHGMTERRFPGFYGFDPDAYLRKNPAVRKLLTGADKNAAARDHFRRLGYRDRLAY